MAIQGGAVIPGDILVRDTERVGGMGTYKKGRTIYASVVGTLRILNDDDAACCEVGLDDSTRARLTHLQHINHRF